MEPNSNLGSKVDELDWKYRECVAYLVNLFKCFEEPYEQNRVGARSYAFLSSLEKVMMDAGEEAYRKYINEKHEKKIYEQIDLLYDLVDRDEGILCYYHNKKGIEGDMTGESKMLWSLVVQCVYDGLQECKRSIGDLVYEIRRIEDSQARR